MSKSLINCWERITIEMSIDKTLKYKSYEICNEIKSHYYLYNYFNWFSLSIMHNKGYYPSTVTMESLKYNFIHTNNK